MLRELGFKFGDMWKQKQAPNFSFGTSDREGRAKLFSSGELNKDSAGTFTPGPCTAVRVDGRPSSPEWTLGGNKIERSVTQLMLAPL